MVRVNYEELKGRFLQAGQGHVFRFWDTLDPQRQEQLLAQAASIDLDLMEELWRRYILNPRARHFSGTLDPPDVIPLPRTPEQLTRAQEARVRGEEALRAGQVGIILVAGGQATRLGYPHPKGTLPIGPISGKSIFQFHAEKILALSRRYQQRLPWYIMTSESTHAATVEFFERHHHFGLPAQDVRFFPQQMLPAMDAQGKFFLEAPHRIFVSPDGHGGLLRALHTNDCLRDMQERGLRLLFYFQVDNVLIKICDPVFLGYHLVEQAEVSAKVLRRRDGLEKMGIAGKVDGRAAVIEYSDFPLAELTATQEDGSLRYWAGSIAIHVFNLDFLQRLQSSGFRLPYHVAEKKIPYLNEEGKRVYPSKENGYKFEQFIFDVLPQAERVVFMEVAREEEFSAVKNDNGLDSPATAKRDMMRLWARWLEAAGCNIRRTKDGDPVQPVEISPLRALEAGDLAASLPLPRVSEGPLLLEA
ncbi:MAG: UDPGP type 1 family protein [candidate division KSB1 bacterium]|nr:UDPGP type 1 family protein [candidate division KSB1 bacterium]